MFANLWKFLKGERKTPPVSDRGAEGESLAVKHLERKGFDIVERNWRSKIGELDVIAIDNGVYVFVEVKSAGKESDFRPEMRVNREKQQRIKRLAHAFLKSRRLDVQVRYDIISVVWTSGKATIEHFENAFS